jgi:hypothetical protein
VTDAISITPVSVVVHPSTEGGTFGTTDILPISGTQIDFGKVASAAGKISVPYSVSKLPFGLAIQLLVQPRQVEGTFVPESGSAGAVLEIGKSVVSGLDFRFQGPPK